MGFKFIRIVLKATVLSAYAVRSGSPVAGIDDTKRSALAYETKRSISEENKAVDNRSVGLATDYMLVSDPNWAHR